MRNLRIVFVLWRKFTIASTVCEPFVAKIVFQYIFRGCAFGRWEMPQDSRTEHLLRLRVTTANRFLCRIA